MKGKLAVTEYTGPLVKKKMRGVVKTAYISWMDQRARCTNVKNKSFKNYGAKGLKVSYSSRDFINWWLRELSIKKLKGIVVCERLDHSKGYSFENIKLGTQSTNAKESAERTSKLLRVRVVQISIYGKVLQRFDSVTAAARYAGVTPPSIVGVCKGHYTKTRKGLIFRYEK